MVSIAPAAIVVAAGLFLSGRVSETAFLALAVAAGLPHGAFDHLVGKRTFGAEYGAAWWRPFLTGYLTLIAATLLVWWAMPGVALLTFLCLSLLHFGDEDAAGQGPLRFVRIVAHGGAVTIVPAVCHPAVVERLFAVLAPAHEHMIQALLRGPLGVAWVAAAGTTLLVHIARGGKRDWAMVADLMLVALLFAVATPLVAFALYFAAIHTPRALATALPTYRRSGSAMVIPVILTALALVLGVVIFVLGRGTAFDEDAVRSAFLLLSALTVPHMWLEWRSGFSNRSDDLVMTAGPAPGKPTRRSWHPADWPVRSGWRHATALAR